MSAGRWDVDEKAALEAIAHFGGDVLSDAHLDRIRAPLATLSAVNSFDSMTILGTVGRLVFEVRRLRAALDAIQKKEA